MERRSTSPIVKWMPAVLVAAGIAVLSLWENPRLPGAISASDKILHGVMYLVLAAAMMVPLAKDAKERVAPYIYVWLGATAYGALMEALQRFCTLTRSGEMVDLYADAIGALGGVVIFAIYLKTHVSHR